LFLKLQADVLPTGHESRYDDEALPSAMNVGKYRNRSDLYASHCRACNKTRVEFIAQISMWRLFGVHIYLKAVKGFHETPEKRHVEHRHFHDRSELHEVPTGNVQTTVHPSSKMHTTI